MRSYAHSLNGLERPLPPENEDLYRTKPLPLPPTTHRDASRSTPSLHSSPPRPLPLVLPPRNQTTDPMNLPSPSNARRRSSHKLNQLTGHDVGSYDYLPVRRILTASASPTDTSSNHSQFFESPIMEEDRICETPRYSQSSGPPPLEPDCDGVSSKRSSGAPKSPRAVQFSTPPTKPLPQMHFNSAPGSLDHVPGLPHVPFPEDIPWRGSKSFTYFSDAETADEYHKITSDLATLPVRRPGASPLMTPTQASFSSRLSLSAKTLFSLRRGRPGSTESGRTSVSTGARPKTPHSRNNSVTSETNIVSPPRSVFESDDEDEDDEAHHVREAIKDLFTRRGEDRASVAVSFQRTPPLPPPPRPERPEQPERPERPANPSIFAKTGDQVKGLLATAKDGAKSMHTSRAEKRRNELRSRIRVIPEVTMEENMI